MKQIEDMTREELEKALRDERFRTNLLSQEVEAFSNKNRYFFAERFPHLGCMPDHDKLMEYYINSGAAQRHREKRGRQ